MELLENQNPERRKLMEASDRYKRELQNDINEISVKTEKVITNALVIGGTLALTYFIVNQLTSNYKRPRKKKGSVSKEQPAEIEAEEIEEPSLLSKLGTKLVDQATILLLDIAKEKLAEYIQSKKREDS